MYHEVIKYNLFELEYVVLSIGGNRIGRCLEYPVTLFTDILHKIHFKKASKVSLSELV